MAIPWECMSDTSSYTAICHLQCEASERGEPTAVGLYRQMANYKCMATLFLLCDVLPHVCFFSRLFQKDLAEIGKAVNTTLCLLRPYQSGCNPNGYLVNNSIQLMEHWKTMSHLLTNRDLNMRFKGLSYKNSAKTLNSDLNCLKPSHYLTQASCHILLMKPSNLTMARTRLTFLPNTFLLTPKLSRWTGQTSGHTWYNVVNTCLCKQCCQN